MYDSFFRIYLTDIDLSGLNLQEGYYCRTELSKKRGRNRINSLVKDLLSIRDISEIYVAPNYFKVWIKQGRDWTDVHLEIIEILEEAIFKIVL